MLTIRKRQHMLTEGFLNALSATEHMSLNRMAHDGEPVTEDSHRTCPGHAAYRA